MTMISTCASSTGEIKLSNEEDFTDWYVLSSLSVLFR